MAKVTYTIIVSLLFVGVARAVLDISSLSGELKDLAETLHTTCVDETEVDAETIKKAATGEFDDSNEKLKCYMGCLFKKAGTLDDDNKFDFASVEKVIPAEHMDGWHKTQATCVPKATGANHCEIAYAFMKCAFETNPDTYFLY